MKGLLFGYDLEPFYKISNNLRRPPTMHWEYETYGLIL